MHNNVRNQYLIFLVFDIKPTPGPGAYALVAEVQKNGSQMIAKYQRTKNFKIS